MEQVRYRVGIMRSSGSVWLQEYPSLGTILDALPDILNKHPHVFISRQKLKESEMNDGEGGREEPRIR
tara:strand:+ start:24650 stop:24853 length:204 start_codon:yes stop_codon:yes gene_type:complete